MGEGGEERERDRAGRGRDKGNRGEGGEGRGCLQGESVKKNGFTLLGFLRELEGALGGSSCSRQFCLFSNVTLFSSGG